MYRDCGWVRLHRSADGSIVGRGHLKLREWPARDGHRLWEGVLDSLHLAAQRALPPGRYVMEFEASPEVFPVIVDQVRRLGDGCGTARVQRTDSEALPLPVMELATG